jgi:hypothetical protein
MKTLVLFFLLCISFLAHGQSQKQWLKHADKSFGEKDFYGASIYYRKAMLVDSSNMYVVYRYAESLRQYNEYKQAEKYYKYVYSKDKARAYQESLFWMAMMQKYNGKYIDARKGFILFVNSYKQKDSYFYKKASQEIKSCEYAIDLIKNPKLVRIYNLGDSLNSTDADFGALQVNDSTLYFSSVRPDTIDKNKSKPKVLYFTKIYSADKSDTTWKINSALDTVLNKPDWHNANGSFNHNGSKFYFSRCDADMKCEILVSELKDNLWTSAKKLNSKINLSGYTNTQPSISLIDTTEVLFFVSDRPGQGKLDIWLSPMESGDFTDPVNLGSLINTVDDELSPWYDNKNKTLYFSSSWHYGLGGQDIFQSIVDSNGFAKPLNLGAPINSSVNDMYFTKDSASRTGFLTSNRKGSMEKKGETCCNDLWRYQYYDIIKKDTTPVVQPDPIEELAKFLPIKLYFHNDEPNPRSKDTITDLNYLSTYQSYRSMTDLYKENYSKGLDPEKSQAAQDSMQSFFDNQADPGVKELEAFSEMLLRQLNKGYKLDLTIKGHASSLAKTDYNVQLTLRRISSFENYLKEYNNGIFIPYLVDSASNGGHLKITKIPFGEYKTDKYQSDNLNDKKNSVYSISAALSRNIELVSLTLEHKDSTAAQIKFRKEIQDFGTTHEGNILTHIFKFRNMGKSDLVIQEITSSCSCVTSKLNIYTVPPGEKGEIEVSFDTQGLKGKQIHSIEIKSNAVQNSKELIITAEIK